MGWETGDVAGGTGAGLIVKGLQSSQILAFLSVGDLDSKGESRADFNQRYLQIFSSWKPILCILIFLFFLAETSLVLATVSSPIME